MLTRAIIQDAERESKRHMQCIRGKVEKRRQSDKAWREWEDACKAWHSAPNLPFQLWSIDNAHKMAAGDRETIEDAILLLEVDPYYFRSGYLKLRVLSHLRKALLNEDDRRRVRDVVVNVAMGKSRADFRESRRLALRLWTAKWEEELRHLNRAACGGKWGRVANLLEYFAANRWNIEVIQGRSQSKE